MPVWPLQGHKRWRGWEILPGCKSAKSQSLSLLSQASSVERPWLFLLLIFCAYYVPSIGAVHAVIIKVKQPLAPGRNTSHWRNCKCDERYPKACWGYHGSTQWGADLLPFTCRFSPAYNMSPCPSVGEPSGLENDLENQAPWTSMWTHQISAFPSHLPGQPSKFGWISIPLSCSLVLCWCLDPFTLLSSFQIPLL